MDKLILFLKGFIIGIGKIIPGVSGSILAVSMGIYETAISKIANLKSNFKNNLIYLGILGSGILLAIIIFSKMILFLVTNNPSLTLTFFLGLFLGSIIHLKHQINWTKKDIIIIFLIIFFLFTITKNISFPEFTITSPKSYLWVLLLGGIDALSVIVPGLSGTSIFIMLGSYPFILKLFSNPLHNPIAAITFIIGFILIFFIITKLLDIAFHKNKNLTWLIIFSFIIYSFLELLLLIPFNLTWLSLILYIIIFLSGYLLSFLVPHE